jgi:hypothetical protein
MKMLPRVLVLLALYSGSAATAFAANPLDEVRRSFTIGGKPIPPEIFADFGDAMMSDNRPIVVTIDANAAIDSNRYADQALARDGPYCDVIIRRWSEMTGCEAVLEATGETFARRCHAN